MKKVLGIISLLLSATLATANSIAWLIASWQGASGVSGLAPKSVMRYVRLGKDVFLICFSIFVLSLKALSKSIELAVANVAERRHGGTAQRRTGTPADVR